MAAKEIGIGSRVSAKKHGIAAEPIRGKVAGIKQTPKGDWLLIQPSDKAVKPFHTRRVMVERA